MKKKLIKNGQLKSHYLSEEKKRTPCTNIPLLLYQKSEQKDSNRAVLCSASLWKLRAFEKAIQKIHKHRQKRKKYQQ